MEQARLQVEVKAFGGRPVISAAGDLDAWTAETFREAVHSVLQEGPESIIVDLTKVTFMDSGALQILVGACHELAASGRLYAVANGAPERLIRITGLDRLIQLRRTLDEVHADPDDA